MRVRDHGPIVYRYMAGLLRIVRGRLSLKAVSVPALGRASFTATFVCEKAGPDDPPPLHDAHLVHADETRVVLSGYECIVDADREIHCGQTWVPDAMRGQGAGGISGPGVSCLKWNSVRLWAAHPGRKHSNGGTFDWPELCKNCRRNITGERDEKTRRPSPDCFRLLIRSRGGLCLHERRKGEEASWCRAKIICEKVRDGCEGQVRGSRHGEEAGRRCEEQQCKEVRSGDRAGHLAP